MSRPEFPEVPIAEWTVARPYTAPGLFVERCMQVQRLLELPDFGGGDLTAEQRRDALRRHLNIHRPLPALAIFLAVVALENYFRDLGARLADLAELDVYFPAVGELRSRTLLPRVGRPFARLDRDPVPLDFHEVNRLYVTALGVSPLPTEAMPKLYDLALLRHTVAHHGAVIREVEVPFQMRTNQPLQLTTAVTRCTRPAGRT